MGLFKLKTAIIGLTSILASASLFADCTLDDNQDATNQNEFGYYWYYYDDIGGIKPDDRPQAAPKSTPSVVNVPYKTGPRHALGNQSDNFTVKFYTFTIGHDGDNSYATLPFTLGSEWDATNYTATPYVGMGTMLNKDGASLDMTGMTKITFKARAHQNDLSCVFKLQTLDIDKDSTFAYFQYAFTAKAGTWTTIEVNNDPKVLTQPSWATSSKQKKASIDIKECTKMAWEVPGSANTITSDTLDIDDITITGYTFVSRFMWTPTVPLTTFPANGQFATFEKQPKNGTPLGTWWYAYNDAQVGMAGKPHGTSSVTPAYATLNDSTKLLNFKFVKGYGSGEQGSGNGTGATIEYQLGPAIQKDDTTLVQGFVGVGVNTYDSSSNTYFAAKDSGAKSIYFHYMAYSDIKYISLEISDYTDVNDAAHPTKADGRGPGVVYFRNLPNTDGEWKAVEIPFDSLLYHDDWGTAKNIPFDPNKIAKVQWKVQGAEGKSGIYSIDNVFFPGVKSWPFDSTTAAKPWSHTTKTSAFRTSYLNGNVSINWDNASITSGKINLINTKGAIVKSTSIAKANNLKANFSAKELPAGMYFVKINAVNSNGKAVVKQSPINILK